MHTVILPLVLSLCEMFIILNDEQELQMSENKVLRKYLDIREHFRMLHN
jgi:hypothetical protein